MKNNFTEINEGGLHEENKLGGVPMGVGQNGQLNTVEENETINDKFVYSNRITLTPQVIAQFNLPKSLSGKTAADATKLINNKFEGRNSKIDNNTKKAFLDRIAEAQETVKAEEQAKIQEAMQINSQEVPDMMEGQIPQGMEEFTQPQQQMAYGGKMSQNQMLFGGNSQQGQMAGDMTGQVATTAADMFFPGSGQFLKMGDQFGTQVGNMIGGDKGEQIGGLISPMGTLKGIGTSITTGNINDIPGIGLFGGKTTKQKEIQKMKFNKDMFESNSKISNFAFGGNLGDPETYPKPVPTVKTGLKTEIVEGDSLPGTHNSRLMGPIHEIQPGSDKSGQGNFIYYKPRTTPGFNRETDREFVSEKNMNDIYRSREYLAYMANRQKQVALNRNPELTQPLPLNNTTTFRMGGNMYEGGGELKPWQQPSSKMTDDPNFNGGFGFKNMTGAPYATELPLDQQVNVKYTPERGKFYKQSFNQMGRPQISNDLGYTSKLNYNDPDIVNLSPEQLEENNGYSNPELAPENKYVSPYPKAKLGETLNKAGQYIKDNYGNALRYAPVAMNAYQLAKMGKPEVETLDRLGNKYNPQYMDEKALTNQINAETNYTANALANASNGSLGSLSNNILGMQLNKTKALSDAYSKVADVNRNEDKTAQQFNLGVDQINLNQSNNEKDINAKNRGAFKTERSKLLGQIGNDLGNIGKETVYKKLAGEAFGYSYDGKYLLKPDGTKVSEEELDSTIKTNLSSVGATEKDGKYFDTTGKEISKEEVLKMIGTQKTFNKNYQGKFSSMNTNFGNISLTNNNKQ